MARPKRYRHLILLAGMLAGAFEAPVSAHAQDVTPGQRIRAMVAGGPQIIGVVSQIDGQSLALMVDGSTVPVSFALADIVQLERSIGQQHQGKKWGMYGAAAGGGLGILSGLTWLGWGGEVGLAAGLYVGAVNAIWLGGAGYLAGRFLGEYDIWQPVDRGGSEQQGVQLLLGIGSGGPNLAASPVLVGVSIPW